MRRRLAALAAGLLAASVMTTSPAEAARLTWSCDPDPPRDDVYMCAGGLTHPRGDRRVLGKVYVASSGDNSELEDCPATTYRIYLLNRRGVVRRSLSGRVCDPDYDQTIYRFQGMRVNRHSRFLVTYSQKLNMDNDERGIFAFRIR